MDSTPEYARRSNSSLAPVSEQITIRGDNRHRHDGAGLSNNHRRLVSTGRRGLRNTQQRASRTKLDVTPQPRHEFVEAEHSLVIQTRDEGISLLGVRRQLRAVDGHERISGG